MPSLHFDGLQAYAGHLMHVTGHAQRKSRSVATFAKAIDTKEMIEKSLQIEEEFRLMDPKPVDPQFQEDPKKESK